MWLIQGEGLWLLELSLVESVNKGFGSSLFPIEELVVGSCEVDSTCFDTLQPKGWVHFRDDSWAVLDSVEKGVV